MSISRKLITAFVVFVCLSLCVAASASVQTMSSSLTGTGKVKLITCDAAVDVDASGVYTYSYALNYTNGSSPVHIFEVLNPNTVPYSGADNTPDGKPSQFDNPPDGSSFGISWINGIINPGEARTFSYQSRYAPMEITVWAYAIDSGNSAMGSTIGMGDKIPEPGSVAVLALGLAGLPMIKRRRK